MVVVNMMLGIRESQLWNSLPKIHTSIQHRYSQVITIQVLLHSYEARYNLWNKIIGAPTFKFNLERGNPEGVWDRKNSWGIWSVLSLLPFTLSIKSYVCMSPGNFVNKDSLNSETTSLQKIRITRSQKKRGLFPVSWSSWLGNTDS